MDIDRRGFLKYMAAMGMGLALEGCFPVRKVIYPIKDETDNPERDEIERPRQKRIRKVYLAEDEGSFSDPLVEVYLHRKPELQLHYGLKTNRYPVVVGKRSSPTPRGEFEITEKTHFPSWYPTKGQIRNSRRLQDYFDLHSGRNYVPHGHPLHPLGDWKLRLSHSRYLIHGNGDEKYKEGDRFASGGCIRMIDSDLEEFVEFVGLGTRVIIS